MEVLVKPTLKAYPRPTLFSLGYLGGWLTEKVFRKGRVAVLVRLERILFLVTIVSPHCYHVLTAFIYVLEVAKSLIS